MPQGEIQTWNFSQNFGPGSNVYPDRQQASHPHGAFVYNEFVYVTDLGADKIWHFQVIKCQPPKPSIMSLETFLWIQGLVVHRCVKIYYTTAF